jgi:hypothetical protein
MWQTVPTIYWNHMINTDLIRAVSIARGRPRRHVKDYGQYQTFGGSS